MYEKYLKGIYPITQNKYVSDKSFIEDCLRVINTNINVFQFRPKLLSYVRRIRITNLLYKECQQNDVKLILNDFEDEVTKYDEVGIHIGFDVCKVKNIRNKLGANRIIGISCYDSLDNAKYCEKNKASYVSFGSMYRTNNKVNFTLCNKNIIKEAKDTLDIPICVIGGINAHNIRELVILKPDMIALIDGVFNQIDPVESLDILLKEFSNEEI
tara:strand:+ start:2749 stop:3387 length:639 start_codon:yes stop_codon:yes gene_type:complete